MQKILIVGGDGHIGANLTEHLSALPYQVMATSRRCQHSRQIHLDLANYDGKPLAESGFSTAVIAASVTGFDVCRTNPEETRKINVEATLALAETLLEQHCRIVFLSSTSVFSGAQHAPNELDDCKPTTEYGYQKRLVEQRLLTHGEDIAILRLTKVVSTNLTVIASIIQSLKNNQTVRVFKDLFISPISLDYTCGNIATLIQSSASGIFHLSNQTQITYEMFAKLIAKKMGKSDKLVEGVATPKHILKPNYANLGMKRTTSLLDIQPETVESVIDHMSIN